RDKQHMMGQLSAKCPIKDSRRPVIRYRLPQESERNWHNSRSYVRLTFSSLTKRNCSLLHTRSARFCYTWVIPLHFSLTTENHCLTILINQHSFSKWECGIFLPAFVFVIPNGLRPQERVCSGTRSKGCTGDAYPF